MVARTIFLRFWWLTRRHDDRQERFPSKVCARLFREFMEARFFRAGHSNRVVLRIFVHV